MAKVTKDCGCSSHTPCSPVTCTSYVAPECDAFNLSTSNTSNSVGISDVSDITLDVKKISAFKDHLEFVNSPKGLSNIVGHTVLRLSNKFLDSITNLFNGRNIGTGVQIYKGASGLDTFQDFRTIKNSQSITFTQTNTEIIGDINEQWFNSKIPIAQIEANTSAIINKLDKPTTVGTVTNYPFVVSVDTNGTPVRIPYQNVGKTYTNIDSTLRIDDTTIGSNVSIHEENFFNLSVITLSFEPTQILGVYIDGLKINDLDYIFTVPKTITLLVPTTDSKINIQYRYLIN